MFKKIIITSILFLSPVLCYADTPWGVNMHLRERVTESEWDEVLDMAEAGGVEWSREQFNWDVIEPTDDDYNWDQYDSVIEKYQENNINVLGLLTYSSSWASTNPGSSDYYYYEPDEDAWEDYVYQVALRYKDEIDYWEIWNEPNYDGFWKGTNAEYATLLKKANIKIKEANPDAKIVLGGLSGVDTDFLKDVYDTIGDDYFAVVAVHPYRVIDGNFNYSPEYTENGLNTLSMDLRNLNRLMRKNNDKNKPVWITEMGWTTYSDGVTKKAQANMLLRSFLQALNEDNIKKVFWYDFRDNADNDYLESNFGLLENDLNDKKSYRAYSFLSDHLRGYIQNKGFVSTNKAKTLDSCNSLGNWSFVETDYASGQASIVDNTLKVHYQFNKAENSYLQITNSLKLNSNTRALTFKVKGDNKKNDLKLRVTDATGEVFQYELGSLSKQWQTYHLPLKYSASSWNGNEDGVMDRPLAFNGFILDDNPDGNKKSGNLYFDDLKETSEANVYIYKFKRDGDTYYAFWNTTGAKTIRVKLNNTSKIGIYSLGSSSRQVKTSTNQYYNLKASYNPKIIKVIK